MSANSNLSRSAAWYQVGRYVGAWLFVWLLLGLAGGIEAISTSVLRAAVAQVLPAPPVLLDPPVVLRGAVNRDPIPSAGGTHNGLSRRSVAAGSDATAAGQQGAALVALSQSADDSFAGDGFFAAAPAGFDDLLGVQNTQADVFFQGRLLLSTFIEFDLEFLEFLAPEELVTAIPTLENPAQVLASLSGKLGHNSHLLCTLRVRENCGLLEPEVAGIIFDEGKFRVDLFVDPSQLSVQLVDGDRYLPAPSAGWATLHDLALTASGQQDNHQLSVAAESYLSKGAGRVRVRYGLTNTGPALHEASWQWDSKDQEVEAGVFRGARGSSLFINDRRLLGLRIGSSTKTRTDLDNALATPVLIFLDRRSRVDILRGTELLDSRFYDPGNHQLNTTRLPDGAYDINVRIVAADGTEQTQQHFFVRNSLLPPLGEKQYFLEAGAFTEDFGADLPRTVGGGWLRGGVSRRIRENFALEGEVLLSSESSLVQAGAYFLGRGWQMHVGTLQSDRGDQGYSLRGQFQRKRVSFSVSAQHLDSKTSPETLGRFDDSLTSNVDFTLSDDLAALEADDSEEQFLSPRGVVGVSYTQASAALSFPLEIPLWRGQRSKGQGHIRALYNERDGSISRKGIGFNYRAPLFKRNSIRADWRFESLFFSDRSLVQMGVDFRWRNSRHNTSVRPELIASRAIDAFSGERENFRVNPVLNANWNRSRRSERLGDLTEGLYFAHQNDRSVLGGRFSSQSSYGYSDLDVGYARGAQPGVQYAANSRFSLVSKDGRAAFGGGSSQLAAVVVEIEGDLPDADFQIIVDSRVAGYASTTKRGVVSLRPYDTYEVRILPAGDDILGYDEQTYEVTLFPGSVQRLVFAARELRVVIAQAVDEAGKPIAFGKFANVDGYGASDAQGWFQVEVSHSDDLRVRLADGSFCAISLPAPLADDDGLAVLDALVCRPVTAASPPVTSPVTLEPPLE